MESDLMANHDITAFLSLLEIEIVGDDSLKKTHNKKAYALPSFELLETLSVTDAYSIWIVYANISNSKQIMQILQYAVATNHSNIVKFLFTTFKSFLSQNYGITPNSYNHTHTNYATKYAQNDTFV